MQLNKRESPALSGALVAPREGKEGRLLPFGHPGIDTILGGGLRLGRLHELFALEAGDGAAASGLAAILASRIGGTVNWLSERRGRRLYPPGLSALGLDPAHMLLALPPDPLAVLRAALDAVRCAAIEVVVIELWGMPKVLDLTASRRLAVAAEASGVTPLLLRIDAAPLPSSAHTRWSVRSTASIPLEADTPGHPAFCLELLRQRGRPAGMKWLMEWNRDEASFRDLAGASPLSGAVASLAACGTAGDDGSNIRRAS